MARSMDMLSTDARWKLTYDAVQPLHFALFGPRRRAAIAGHISASSDQSSRRFPFLMAGSALLLFADGPQWPAKVALVVVFIANIEQTLISLTLRQPQTDVPSILHALRLRRPPSAPSAPPAREQP